MPRVLNYSWDNLILSEKGKSHANLASTRSATAGAGKRYGLLDYYFYQTSKVLSLNKNLLCAAKN